MWLGALDKLSGFPGDLADTDFPSGASIKQLLSETPINDVLPAILRKWPALTLAGMCDVDDMLKCRLCGKCLSELQGSYLVRVNEQGVPGIWECLPCCEADLSQDR